MTMNDAEEMVHAARVLSRANARFLTSLIPFVDVTSLREGDRDYDYYVDVPSHRLAEVDLDLSGASIDVLERFDAHVAIFAIPYAASKPPGADTSSEELRAAV